jgi:hypothetical protein
MRSHKVGFRHACELLTLAHPALAAAVVVGGSKKPSQAKLRQAQSFALPAAEAAADQAPKGYLDFPRDRARRSRQRCRQTERGSAQRTRETVLMERGDFV